MIDEDLEGSLEARWLERVAGKVLAAQRVDSRVEIGVVITGQERVHQLNRLYLGKDEPTDVLAFPMLPRPAGEGVAPFVAPPDGIAHLGEVIVAYPQAVTQASEHQHTVEKELAILIIHGILHLLGYDHEQPDREQAMKARELEILGLLEGELR